MQADMDRIYREQAVPVYRYLLALTGDAQQAEELTQQVFYEAVRGIHRYDGSCKLYVWLCQIGKRRWYDLLRQKSRRGEEPLPEELPAGACGDPAACAETQEGIQRLYRCIHALPPDSREVVLLRALGGLSFRQIGEIVGQSENAVRVRFYRAKKTLAERLEKDG
ncbi:MAG: sigma-70 family RNA polymerase sigma factor [Oscillospiraceae bacterium]|nr:sigma-70 family RNA polymerase sigma factor [Oscillospiraceae bacterium]